jgi:glutamine cyclotransferase
MINSRLKIPVFTFFTFSIILSLSCCRKNLPHIVSETSLPDQSLATQLRSPSPGTVTKCGDSVKIELILTSPEIKIDSVAVLSGKNEHVYTSGFQTGFFWRPNPCRVGQNTLKIKVFHSDSLQESHTVKLTVLSDVLPVNYTYKVIQQFPHDKEAYTQGLVFDNGYLYESTGLEGKSSLRLVNLATGNPEKIIHLDNKFFGEGIALLKDDVYQITYKNQVGFIYDKKTFEQIRSFDYQINEGWGLTTDGQNLIMSDGTSQLYIIEPEFFTQIDRCEVFDNKGMVSSLNELEYINGKVLANVYGESYIVIIDPITGKVIGKLDLRRLMPKGSEGDMNYVMNGIAYNAMNKHLYITGKHWPVLYEIEIDPHL